MTLKERQMHRRQKARRHVIAAVIGILLLALSTGAAKANSPTPGKELPPVFGEKFTVRISYYWPALGGTNCFAANWIMQDGNPYGGVCRSRLLGQPWSDWAGYGAACSPKIKLGDRMYIERINKVVACVDRGGGIRDLADGTAFVDLLMPSMPRIRDWKVGIIRDKYCPSGCYTSTAWVTDGSVLYQP